MGYPENPTRQCLSTGGTPGQGIGEILGPKMLQRCRPASTAGRVMVARPWAASHLILACLGLFCFATPRICISFVTQPGLLTRAGHAANCGSRHSAFPLKPLVGGHGISLRGAGISDPGGSDGNRGSGGDDGKGGVSKPRGTLAPVGGGKAARAGLLRGTKTSDSGEVDFAELNKTRNRGGSVAANDWLGDEESSKDQSYDANNNEKEVDTPKFAKGERETTGESFWIEYRMRVLHDSPYAAPFIPPTQALEMLDEKKARGEVNDEGYAALKKAMVSSFWSSLIVGSDAQRNIQQREILVQVTNDADFANSWVTRNVKASAETDLGVSIQWVPVSKEAKGKRGGIRKSRHRISLMQLATADEVLILQLAHLQPSKMPSLVAEVMGNSSVVKHGFRMLDDAIKVERDWGTRITSRVDSCEYAASLGYKAKDVCEMAETVLALNYSRPEWIPRSDWEALTLDEMQITCAALDAWVAREASVYVSGVSRTRPVADVSAPQAALAERGINTEVKSKRRKKERLASVEEVRSKGEGMAKGVDEDEWMERDPDKVVYIPKVDVRDGGVHAHWLWRGTRVSDAHIARYCGVKLELEETDQGTATVASLWGPPKAVEEAVDLIKKLLARSQLESEYFALGLGPPQFINRPDANGGMSSIVILNTMEPVEYSFFPSTLTRSFPGKAMEVRGKALTKDVARAAFFSQADAATQAADAMLGKHRPKILEGPLPGGLDPAIMWKATGYTL